MLSKSQKWVIRFQDLAGSTRWALLIPVALFFLVEIENVKLYFSQIDAFLYLGYAIDYNRLQEQWGHTYHASRLSTILPIMLREEMGISEQIWRVGLLSLVALSLYSALLRRTDPVKAFLISIAVSNSVWLMNHLSDDMNFSYAIVYLAITLALYDRGTYIEDQRERKFNNLVTGFFISLTLNSHFIYLFILIPFYFSIKLMRKKYNLKEFGELVQIIFGFLIGYVFILVYSIHLSGFTGILNHLITFKQIFINSGEEGRIWTQPILYFFPFAFIVSIIPLVAIFKFKSTKSQTRNRNLEFATGTLVVGLFSILYHFTLGGPILSITRYCSIYIITILFIVAFLLVDIPKKMLLWAIAIEIFLILLIQITPNWQSTERSISIARVIIILPLLLILTLKRFNFSKARIGFATLLIVFALPITQNWGTFAFSTSTKLNSNGEYQEFLRTMNQGNSVDQQLFAKEVAKSVRDDLPPTFFGWTLYPYTPSWLGAIDSAQLWGYSCYKCMNAGIPIDRDYPPFSSSDLVELQKRDYILIFDTSLDGFNSIKTSLLSASPNFTEGKKHVVVGKANVLYFQYILTGLTR